MPAPISAISDSVKWATLQDAIEDLLVKERLDLPPQLRELDAQVEAVELALRRKIDEDLGGNADRLPPHVRRLMSGF